MTLPPSAAFRLHMGLIVAVCAGLMGFALYAQYHLGLHPCPLCSFQRVCVIVVGVLAFAACVFTPQGRAGRGAWSVGILLACVAGAGIAARHVWIQHLPQDQVPACGPGLHYLLETMPSTLDVVKTVLEGSGDCARVDWSFLGLAMPTWTLLCFVALANWALVAGFPTRK